MSKVVSLMNMKGGVGKTTMAVNLAASAAYDGKRVVVADLDPQANASIWLMGNTEYVNFVQAVPPQKSIVDVFEQFTPSALTGGVPTPVTVSDVIYPVQTWWAKGNLSVLPSRLELSFPLSPDPPKEGVGSVS